MLFIWCLWGATRVHIQPRAVHLTVRIYLHMLASKPSWRCLRHFYLLLLLLRSQPNEALNETCVLALLLHLLLVTWLRCGWKIIKFSNSLSATTQVAIYTELSTGIALLKSGKFKLLHIVLGLKHRESLSLLWGVVFLGVQRTAAGFACTKTAAVEGYFDCAGVLGRDLEVWHVLGGVIEVVRLVLD